MNKFKAMAAAALLVLVGASAFALEPYPTVVCPAKDASGLPFAAAYYTPGSVHTQKDNMVSCDYGPNSSGGYQDYVQYCYPLGHKVRMTGAAWYQASALASYNCAPGNAGGEPLPPQACSFAPTTPQVACMG